jgi:hypothetical protein
VFVLAGLDEKDKMPSQLRWNQVRCAKERTGEHTRIYVLYIYIYCMYGIDLG